MFGLRDSLLSQGLVYKLFLLIYRHHPSDPHIGHPSRTSTKLVGKRLHSLFVTRGKILQPGCRCFNFSHKPWLSGRCCNRRPNRSSPYSRRRASNSRTSTSVRQHDPFWGHGSLKRRRIYRTFRSSQIDWSWRRSRTPKPTSSLKPLISATQSVGGQTRQQAPA